ncbi:Glycine betaine transporter OpuD [Pseudovibrio sp. W64]|uniref:BCCT family transporter n=1 Tax=unclassified Pseudovibrio TaxID=2627060 RepID=UPI0007B2E84D|nr:MULTISPECIES: BCCT family transporter [unclassified Pseudovibrio]KZK78705.1 Glycine betaine transporter OpuD [Pseudovibrio sp. W64]KZK82857.1 Glycine betaine transporter OpuD [Pseudovibrio sp. Ad13]KZK97794.1 Glycine betaine transporter OpuD [Pseudovibrio sp. Ad5]KZL02390.1 Glycine betaine transporter OpuD [Pseudovibrio sp. W74]KZL08066.1 Glycine betaine transporter OpuD [Pseudovibrio sp. Ad14]
MYNNSNTERRTGEGLFTGVNPVMAVGSTVLVIAFVLFTVMVPETAGSLYNSAKGFIANNLSWYYIGLVSFFLFLAFAMTMSRYGNIRLGKDDEKPEYSFFSWFSMLFGAGIGIGILFWSIAEPIYHFQSNPFIAEGQESSVEAAQIAMRISIFHWGLHGWALFALSGLGLAYFHYRKGLPLSVRSGLYPIFGDKIYGPIGHAADLLAVFGTVFGIATSLGLGAQQMNTGLNYLFGFEVSITNKIIIIAVISVLATMSVLSGVNKGIKILSEFNMHLTMVMLVFFLIFGPTVYILGSFATNLGDYLTNAIPLGFWVETDPSNSWQGGWTIFYWGWWIAWAPFVGIFIARISRGRTVKEFLLGVLLAPTLLSTFWITTFGNTAMFLELFGAGGVTEAVNADITSALYTTIELMDLGSTLTILGAAMCTVLLVTYFVTSADSATLVICTILSMGDENPANRYRIFWGLSIGAVSAVLLFAGGLRALQTASIVAALPYSFVLILTTWGLLKSLHLEVSEIISTIDDEEHPYSAGNAAPAAAPAE